MAISAFWRRKVDLPPMFGPVSSQIAPCLPPSSGDRSQSLATKGAPAGAAQRLLDHRVAAASNLEGEAVVDHRPPPRLGAGQHRERRRNVEHRQRRRAGADRVGMADRLGGQRVEDAELDRQRAVGGVGDLGLHLRQFGGGEAHGVRHGLAVDEACLAPRPSRS